MTDPTVDETQSRQIEYLYGRDGEQQAQIDADDARDQQQADAIAELRAAQDAGRVEVDDLRARVEKLERSLLGGNIL